MTNYRTYEQQKNGYRRYIQKIITLQVIQQIFCEILISGRKVVYSDIFFGVTNIRTNVQNYSSEFEGLLHEMVSKKPYVSQYMCYINGNSERKLCTVPAYIKRILEHSRN